MSIPMKLSISYTSSFPFFFLTFSSFDNWAKCNGFYTANLPKQKGNFYWFGNLPDRLKKNKGKMINSSQHREEETSYLSACFAFSDKESENVAYVDILVFVNTILWLVYYGPAKCSSHYLHSFQMFPQFPLYGNWSYLNYSNLKAYSGTLSRRNFGRFKAT